MIDTTVLGFIASIFTTVSFLPQVIKTWKTKRTKDISLPMYIILDIGAILWFIYGILLHAMPIYIVNALVFLLTTPILFLKIKHG